MPTEFDDNSWEQVYGLMRCNTKFDQIFNVENEDKEINYFDY